MHQVACKPKEDEQKAEEELEVMRLSIGCKEFHDQLHVGLNALLKACQILSTGEIQRTQNTGADIASKACNAVGEILPFGFVAKAIAAVVTTLTDMQVQTKNARINFILLGKDGPLSEQLAFHVTKYFKNALQCFDPQNAEQMAAKAIQIIGEKLIEDAFYKQVHSVHRTRQAQQQFIADSLINAVTQSKLFQETVEVARKSQQQKSLKAGQPLVLLSNSLQQRPRGNTVVSSSAPVVQHKEKEKDCLIM